MATWKTIMARPAEYTRASREQVEERAGKPSWPSRVEPTTRGTVSGDGVARAVSRTVSVSPRRLPARSDPGDRGRTVRHRVGADRGGEDARRRVRHPHGARHRQAHRLHDAAQGALEPEVQRLHPGPRRRDRRYPDR